MVNKPLKKLLSHWERLGEGFLRKAENKETPGPLNRKRSRKGSRGQRSQNVIMSRISQIFCIRIRILSERGTGS